MIESHAVYYGPSLGVLGEMRKRKDANDRNTTQSLLALGNPFTGKEVIAQLREARRGDNFEPLPDSETEVRALTKIFSEAQSKALIGVQADEKTFKSMLRSRAAAIGELGLSLSKTSNSRSASSIIPTCA